MLLPCANNANIDCTPIAAARTQSLLDCTQQNLLWWPRQSCQMTRDPASKLRLNAQAVQYFALRQAQMTLGMGVDRTVKGRDVNQAALQCTAGSTLQI